MGHANSGHFRPCIRQARPWHTYGESPTVQPEGSFEDHQQFAKIKYSYRDARYTTKDGVIYPTTLGRPETEIIIFAADQLQNPLEIQFVSLLRSNTPVKRSLTKTRLRLSADWRQADPIAVALKIILEQWLGIAAQSPLTTKKRRAAYP